MINEAEQFEYFVEEQIKIINEYFQWEKDIKYWIETNLTKWNLQFIIIDKNWIEKWKEIIEYNKIKDKCQSFVKNPNYELKNEIKEIFFHSNAMEKLYHLGKMDNSKIKKIIANKYIGFNEESNFIPIESNKLLFFSSEFEKIYASGECINGRLILYNNAFEEKENQKIVIFQRKKSSNELKKILIILNKKFDIKYFKEKIKNKGIKDFLKDKKILKMIFLMKEILENKEENKLSQLNEEENNEIKKIEEEEIIIFNLNL